MSYSLHESGNYDERYMKIKFNLDNNFSLKKALQTYNVVIIATSGFHEDNNDCFYVLLTLLGE